LAEAAGPQRESALHLAANLDDGGRMAGLLLAHAACPAAAALWAAHKDAGGCTPADIAFRSLSAFCPIPLFTAAVGPAPA
jgi:hypothetical protein